MTEVFRGDDLPYPPMSRAEGPMAKSASGSGLSNPTVLADYTTLGLGGPARVFASADTEQALIDALRDADASGEPALLIGGGSNLVISDTGFPGTVVHVNTRGLTYVDDGDGSVSVTVAAGEDWDDVVAATVAEGLAGLEPLSGVPGRTGATPIQNVGAYGREVAEVITRVRVHDRRGDRILTLGNEGCRFAYRTSLFKSAQARYVVLDVTLRLPRQALSLPVRYAELAAGLGVALGERASVAEA
ncbi:MAG: UDP-N-acetylmuramate dehydrogenase, partial [Trebonia sp.]